MKLDESTNQYNSQRRKIFSRKTWWFGILRLLSEREYLGNPLSIATPNNSNHWPPGPKPQLQRKPLEVVRLHINKASSWQNYHISKMILGESKNFAQAHLLLDFFEIPN